jgi:pimeloyl-ACP methyl ester carboxylesterase
MAKDGEVDSDLTVAKQGCLYVGGEYVTRQDGEHLLYGQGSFDYQIPARLTHPYPIVMIHGSGQNGSNWIGTPDGREGWAQFFLKRGYAVYVMDQPGRGRTVYDPAYEKPYEASDDIAVAARYGDTGKWDLYPQAKLHTQWPGAGVPGDPIFDQFYASQMATIPDQDLNQRLARDAAAALLDQIGPAILMTHSQGGAIGWVIADARPKLVKGVIAVEPGPIGGNITVIGPPDYFRYGKITRHYGLSINPLKYEPAVNGPGELELIQQDKPDGPGLARCWFQKEPARKLVNLAGMPIAIVTGEASPHTPYDHATSRYLKQAGVENTHIKLADLGIKGNGHMMMLEKNNLEVAAVIYDWLEKNVAPAGKDRGSAKDGVAIAEQGYRYVGGTYRKQADGNHLMVGKEYVEYQTPKNRKHPYPIVMIHGGGQCGTSFTHTPDNREGWIRSFLRRGYAVYVVDQPGRGRAGFDMEIHGPIKRRSAEAVARRYTATGLAKEYPQAHLHTQWPGTGIMGDPVFDRLYASQLPLTANQKISQTYNQNAGRALLDEIGPAIIMTHSQSGSFGWLIGDARPNLVKAIVAVEPASALGDFRMVGAPEWFRYEKTENPGQMAARLTWSPAPEKPEDLKFVLQDKPDAPDLVRRWVLTGPKRKLVNLAGIPIAIITGEASPHAAYDHGTSAFLREAGVENTHIKLADLGIRGNGHMMMYEKNSEEIAGLIAGWLEKNVAPVA